MKRLLNKDGAVKCTLWTTTWLSLLLLLSLLPSLATGYSVNELDLNPHVISGLWKLTGTKATTRWVVQSPHRTMQQHPLKEFTVYPKRPPEVHYLMLKKDGSYTVIRTDEGQTRNNNINNNIKVKGTWQYQDGKLLLAADRLSSVARPNLATDLVLVGRVAVTTAKTMQSNQESGLLHEPTHSNNADDKTAASSSSSSPTTSSSSDLYLSVNGKVQLGKFMYPKKHSRFFEQPMVRSLNMGRVQLQQVVGHRLDEVVPEKIVEKFSRHDFADKKFWLTSSPITRKPKKRWSIKLNKFVEDKPKEEEDDDDKKNGGSMARMSPIRVMEVQLFRNLTFASTAGLGSSMILRGKWDVIGEARDQFWMQIWRFGFGRSVSGSTYSEGRGLSHEDAKSYWGRISHMTDDDDDDDNKQDTKSSAKDNNDSDNNNNKRIQVNGSVIVGFGLEPQPVAKFFMREVENNDEEEEEEEEDDDDDDVGPKFSFPVDPPSDPAGGVDWSNAFQ